MIDVKGEYRRIEVLTGQGRRRGWSADEKGRLVAETLGPGSRVSEVARRWQVCPQQVFGWRREARQDVVAAASKPRAGRTGDFVAILSEAQRPVTLTRKAAAAAPVIEIKPAGTVVRISGPGDCPERTAVFACDASCHPYAAEPARRPRRSARVGNDADGGTRFSHQRT